ncbi:unnamed protein product [Macrosiphum euphorbiae]|uniref:Uncharacterized protein n=1 Tax=Macrosiphum euphorbiae TaxID=13131 RepID=A0AAV0XDA2_9HEMI|nr:unnamed protein product [Macrosiphum euphorbiae]
MRRRGPWPFEWPRRVARDGAKPGGGTEKRITGNTAATWPHAYGDACSIEIPCLCRFPHLSYTFISMCTTTVHSISIRHRS